jgi:hypothetical protein
MSGVAVVQGQFRQGDNLQPVLKDQSGNVKTQHIRGDYIELGDDATLGAFAQSAAFLPPRGFQSAAAATNIGFKGETTAVAAFLPRPGYIYFTTTAAADNWTFTTPALMDAAYPHMAVHDSFIFELGVTGTGSAVLVSN